MTSPSKHGRRPARLLRLLLLITALPGTAGCPAFSESRSTPSRIVRDLRNRAQLNREQYSVAPGTLVSRDQVVYRMAASRYELTTRLGDPALPEYGMLVRYVADSFPAPEAIPRSRADSNAVLAGQAAQAWGRVDSFLTVIQPAVANPIMDLQLEVVPVGASVRLSAYGLSRDGMANFPIRRVHRGQYSYEVRRHAFKPASGQLDLVADPGTVLHCRLRSTESREGSVCHLRTP